MTELDIPALLQALAEQQTALLAVHAENMRVQRVFIEYDTGAGGEPLGYRAVMLPRKLSAVRVCPAVRTQAVHQAPRPIY